MRNNPRDYVFHIFYVKRKFKHVNWLRAMHALTQELQYISSVIPCNQKPLYLASALPPQNHLWLFDRLMVKYQPWTARHSLIGRLNTNTCHHFPPTNLPAAPVGNEDFYLESATTFRTVKGCVLSSAGFWMFLVLACPRKCCQKVRTSGLFHPKEYPVYKRVK